MLDDYFLGTVKQFEKRARLLRDRMPRNLPRDYELLRKTCLEKLDYYLDDLKMLAEDDLFKLPNLQRERLRKLKRLVGDFDVLESIGFAALIKADKSDHKLNSLLWKIKSEINYPYITPVVSTLSQDYFFINTELDLLCIPLLEGEFLLHLPDLYHELAHPLLIVDGHSGIDPFKDAFNLAIRDVFTYTSQEIQKEDGGRGPEIQLYLLKKWQERWGEWLVEFFCDLFGAYTLGPAYGWAHLHLTIKSEGNPFNYNIISHPADSARMEVILKALSKIGYCKEAESIRSHWLKFIKAFEVTPPAEYRRCYPDDLLDKICDYALEGITDMKCRIASPQTGDKIHTLLNQAWNRFWSNPIKYVEWEERAVEQLWSLK